MTTGKPTFSKSEKCEPETEEFFDVENKKMFD